MGGILSGMGMKRKGKKQLLLEAPDKGDVGEDNKPANAPQSEEGEQIVQEQRPAEARKSNSFTDRVKALSGLGGSGKTSNAPSDTAPQSNQGAPEDRKSVHASWDTVLSATVPSVSRASSNPSKVNAWKNAAAAVKSKQRHHSLTPQQNQPDDSAQNGEKLHEIPLSQVMGLRKEFEAVSAPKASMNFQQLNKFQARMIRRQGDAVFKALRANNPLVVNKGKHTEKDVREQAKKTAQQVFKSLGYWDHDEDKATSDCTVTFEQYLAAVFHAKIKGPDLPQYDATSAGLKGILRVQQHAQEKVDEELLVVPLEELKWESLPERLRRLNFVDHPTEEQLESEWKLRQAQEKLELDAEEATAFKLKVQLDAQGADESVDVAEIATFQARMAELEAAHEEAEGVDGDQTHATTLEGLEGAEEWIDKRPCSVEDAAAAASDDDGAPQAGKGLAQVRMFLLTEAEVQYKLANIEQVRKGVQKSKHQLATHAGKT